MTDEPNGPEGHDPTGEPDLPLPPLPSSANGTSSSAARPAVRSGLAHRRNPVLATLGDFAQGARRVALRDPLALFLLLASIGLAIAFAALLGDIKPSSSGTPAPVSTVQTLAKRHEIANALLLDHDNRVEIATTTAAPRLAAAGTLPAPARRTVRTHVKGSKKTTLSTILVPPPAAGTVQLLW